MEVEMEFTAKKFKGRSNRGQCGTQEEDKCHRFSFMQAEREYLEKEDGMN